MEDISNLKQYVKRMGHIGSVKISGAIRNERSRNPLEILVKAEVVNDIL